MELVTENDLRVSRKIRIKALASHSCAKWNFLFPIVIKLLVDLSLHQNSTFYGQDVPVRQFFEIPLSEIYQG